MSKFGKELEINNATFVHQLRDVCASQLVDKSSNIYLIWTKNIPGYICWFASKYASFTLLAQVPFNNIW